MREPDGMDRTFENVGPGPDSLSLAAAADGHDFLVVFLQRDHYCTNCRQQVQTVKHRYDEFRARGAEPVSIVPEPAAKVAAWQDRYDLPYPLLADPDAAAGDNFDQPVRFAWLGSLSDFLGRMPAVVVLDARGPAPEIAWVHRGSSTFDRPDLDAILERLDDLRASDGGPAGDEATAEAAESAASGTVPPEES